MTAAPRRAKRRRLRFGFVAATFVVAATAPALADSVTNLAKRLSSLRGEVEALSADLAAKNAEIRDQLRSYSRQKADLELEVQREQTRLQKIRQSIDKKKETIAKTEEQQDDLAPVFEKNLAKVRKHVKGTLPFRTEERLAELAKLEEQRKSGLLDAPRAVARLWSFVEDEERLTRENGLYQQTIVLDGKEQLADVIRVGMVMLYFKTSDARVGYVKPAGDLWEYHEVTGPDDRKRIHDLFDQFKKQIRVGYFELPNALPRKAE